MQLCMHSGLMKKESVWNWSLCQTWDYSLSKVSLSLIACVWLGQRACDKSLAASQTWISWRVLMMKLSLDEISLLSRSPCLLAMASVASRSSRSHSKLRRPFRSCEATHSDTSFDPWQFSLQCWNSSRVRPSALQTSLQVIRDVSQLKRWHMPQSNWMHARRRRHNSNNGRIVVLSFVSEIQARMYVTRRKTIKPFSILCLTYICTRIPICASDSEMPAYIWSFISNTIWTKTIFLSES